MLFRSALLLSLVPSLQAQELAPAPGELSAARERLWWSDFDGDGRLDAYTLDTDGHGRLLRGEAAGRFTDATETAGLAGVERPVFAAWGDFDQDARVDLFLATEGGSAHLFRGTASGVFEDDSSLLPRARGVLSAHWLDVDADGFPDLHLHTRRGEQLLRNLDGRLFEFVELTGEDPQRAAVDESPTRRAGSEALEEGAPAEERVPERGGSSERPGRSKSGAATPELGGERAPLEPAPGRENMMGCATVSVEGANSLGDQALAGNCLLAASEPTLGMLYPLSVELFVQSSPGRVGLGTVTPAERLDVAGNARVSGQVISTTNAAPFLVTSTKRVVNLNADRLDGLHAGAFAQLPIVGEDIADASIEDRDIAADAAIQGNKIFPFFGDQLVGSKGSANFGEEANQAVYSVRGEGAFGPTNGYLGVQGGPDFDGLPGVNWSSREIGVGGISAGATSSDNYGVLGFSNGAGVRGEFLDGSGAGMLGQAGVGVHGSGITNGVLGESNFVAGQYISAFDGVRAETDGSSGYAVWGEATATSGSPRAVYGLTRASGGTGVFGRVTATSGTNYGVQGRTHSPDGFGTISFGSSGSTGQKSFIQPHPLDPTKEIRFVSLEGNESGTYFRGSARLVGGAAIVAVPEEFRLASEADQLTVQVTPLGGPAQLWVESKDLEGIVVRGTADVEFDYLVNGVRRGFAEVQIVTDNDHYVPERRGVPAFTELPRGVREILVGNGILNPDFTPNEALAASMGWTLADPAAELEAQAETGAERAAVEAEARARREAREEALRAERSED